MDNFSDNAAFFRCKDRSGFIDNKGTVIVSLHSQSKTILLPGFYNGICGIKEADDTWAYINKKAIASGGKMRLSNVYIWLFKDKPF